MSKSRITAAEMKIIETVLAMGGGYVLDFSNRTFAQALADFDVDIERLFPEGSKANRLRALLGSVELSLAGRVLEGLLAYRVAKEGDETSQDLKRYRQIVSRLAGATVTTEAHAFADPLTHDYIQELDTTTQRRLSDGDLEGAITTARTSLEAILRALEVKLLGKAGDHKGDLLRQFKSVAKRLGMDTDRADLDESFKQTVRGLFSIVTGLSSIRNKMSDSHVRERKPAPHHARMVVNAAKTVTAFLVESYLFQRDKGMNKVVTPSTKSASDGAE